MPQNGTTHYWPDDAFKFGFLDGNELTAVVSGDLMKRVATMSSFSMEIETRARRARKRCRVEFTKSYSTQHIMNEVPPFPLDGETHQAKEYVNAILLHNRSLRAKPRNCQTKSKAMFAPSLTSMPSVARVLL
jgi:hypothetical protein